MELFIQWPEGWTVGAPGLTHKDVRNRTAEYDEDDEAYVSILAGGANDQGNNLIKYVYYAKNSDYPLKGGAGAIFRIKVTIPAGIPDGYYPITLVGGGDKSFIACSGNAGSEIWLDTQTSYIKVGNPSNAALALEGTVPSFVNEALAKETALTSLNLEKVTAVNGDFTYVAGRDVVAPATTVEANVKYVAPAPATYATLCLPSEAAVNCWKYSRKEGNVAIFEESTVAPAGEAVIIENAVETAAAKATIAGVAKQDIHEGAYLVGDELHTVKNYATIPALRGYWASLAGSNCRIAFDTATGIQMIGTAADIDNTYDLQGRQVQNAKNGVFVVNGKKQFVK